MGVENLWGTLRLLDKRAQAEAAAAGAPYSSIFRLELREWGIPYGSKVAVDVAVIMFAAMSAFYEGGVDSLAVLRRFQRLGADIRACGWEPLWVFDGEPLAVKAAESAARRAAAEAHAQRRVDRALDALVHDTFVASLNATAAAATAAVVYETVTDLRFPEEGAEAAGGGGGGGDSADLVAARQGVARALAQPSARPTRANYDALREALLGDGWQCAVAPHEAEAHAAWLATQPEENVAAVFTKDSDALAYGAPLVVSGFGTRDAFGVRFEDVLRVTRLSRAAFLDACILLGTDFNKRLPQFGPTKIFKLLGTHAGAKGDSAEALLAWGARTQHPQLGTPYAADWGRRVLGPVRRLFQCYCGSGGPLPNEPLEPTPPSSAVAATSPERGATTNRRPSNKTAAEPRMNRKRKRVHETCVLDLEQEFLLERDS